MTLKVSNVIFVNYLELKDVFMELLYSIDPKVVYDLKEG